MTEANKRQVGGDHYRKNVLEHWDIVALTGLDYYQGNITKYVMRWRDKGGIQDLEKARHYLEKYIELEKLRAKGTLSIDLIRAALTMAETKEESDDDEKGKSQYNVNPDDPYHGTIFDAGYAGKAIAGAPDDPLQPVPVPWRGT